MRGLDAGRVYGYLALLADQVQATEQRFHESQADLQRAQAELQRMQAELDQYEQVGDRVNDQVVQLFSQAQLVVEEMVQDVSRDARERIGEARAQERKIVAEAMDTAGQQVRTYARSAQAQMQGIVDSFATEVDRLGESGTGKRAKLDSPGEWHFQNGSESPGPS
jgi:cell division septum initiation protein DivIVA